MIIFIIATVTCLDVNLTNLQFNYYSLPISANNKTYNLLVDTGNEDIWIFGKNSNRKIFYECQNCTPIKNETLEYVQGKITGVQYNQTFLFLNQTLSLPVIDAIKVEYLYSIIADGAIGLNKKELSKDDNILKRLQQLNVIDSMQFGLLLNEQNCQSTSILSIGQPKKNYFINELQYVKTVESESWTVKGQSIQIVGKRSKQDLESYSQLIIFDSGVSKLLISKYKFNKLIEILNKDYNLDCQQETQDQINQIACSYNEQSYPDLNINIDNNLSLTLLPQDYIDYCSYNYFLQHRCYLHFEQIDSTDVLILGTAFFQKYYTHFDVNTYQIGIAKSIYYQRDKKSLSELGNVFNNSILYFSLFLVIVLLLVVYIILKLLLKHSIPLYLSVLEKSSSRSQEPEMEAITLKTQTNSQPPLTS